MKTPSNFRPQRGFTLIELLVVIAIIAVLAGAGFAVGSAALERARKLAAQNSATAIDQAVNAFFSEYGGFPADGTVDGEGTAVDTSIETTGEDGVAFLNALLGIDRGSNTRGISFLSAKEGKLRGQGGTDGIVYEEDSGNVRGLYDPWGNPFTVVMDTNYTGFVEVTPMNNGTAIENTKTTPLHGRRVAVYSPGVRGGDTATLRTMVKTW